MKRFPLILIAALILTATVRPVLAGPVTELLPGLSTTNMAAREEALNKLLALCAPAGQTAPEKDRQALCAEMSSLLANAEPEAAMAMVRQLRLIGGEESVSALTALLQHQNAVLRDDARQALESIPSSQAAKALLAGLASAKDPREQAGFIDSLGRRGDTGTVAAILPGLASADDLVATAAARALARIASPEAVAELTKASKDAKGSRATLVTECLLEAARVALRQGRAEAAIRIFTTIESSTADEDTRANAFLGLLLADMRGAGARAEKALKGTSESYQLAAVESVTQSGDRRLSGVLARQLSQLPETLQVASLSALAAAGEREASAPAAALLASTNEAVVRASIQALGVIGDGACIPALLRAGATPALAKDVAAALEEINAAGANEALFAALSSEAVSSRSLALDALLVRQAPGLKSHLIQLARGTDEKLAIAALTALKQTAEPADFDAVLSIAAAASSRPLADAALATACALAGRSPDAVARIAEIGARLSKSGVDNQRAMLAALSKFGVSASPEQAAAALTALSPTLDNPALAATAAHFATELAARLLPSDPTAVAGIIARIEKLAVPEDVKARARGITGLDDGWLRTGLIAGPYETKGDLFTAPHAPEQAGAKVAWSSLTDADRSAANPCIINLAKRIPGDNRVGYLQFAFMWPADGAAQLELGSDDGVIVWLNGTEVHRKDATRPCRPGDDVVKIALKKGVNVLLIKVVQRAGNFEFTGRVAAPAPAPAPAT